MLPFGYKDLKLLSMKLLELFLKPEVLEICKNGLDFENVDLFSWENINGNIMCIGYAAAAIISHLEM